VSDHTAEDHESSERDGISRRGFIAGAAGLTGVALSGVWRGAPARAAAAPNATAATGFDFLLLEGTSVGTVAAFEGGNPVGVLADDEVKDPYVHKHIAGVKYENVTLKMGLNMQPAAYEWVSSFLRGEMPRHDGAIVTTDGDLNMKRRMDFVNALITEIGLPALDAASKGTATMTLKFQPESTRTKVVTGKFSGSPSPNKLWSPANFRLTIEGLDCTRVNKIDAFTLKQNAIEKIEIAPGLGIMLSEASSKTWKTYFDSFVLRNSGKELAGKLEYLNSDLSTTLGAVEFGHLGIFMLDPVPGGTIRRVRAEMYGEEVAWPKK